MSKVQLTVDDHPRDGYLYASPKNQEFSKDYKNFGGQYDVGEITEIYGPNFVDYFPTNAITPIISNWYNLLRTNGKLVIGGKDPYILAKRLISRSISIDDYNKELFTGSGRLLSMIGAVNLRKTLEEIGFVIDLVYFDNDKTNYTISARKV